MRKFGSVLLAVLLSCQATAALGEIVTGDSLEWLTCQSDLIVVGRIEKIVSTAPAKEYRNPVVHEITFVVTETIHGQSDNRIVIHFSSFSAKVDAVLASSMRSTEPTLFFLTRDKDKRLTPTPANVVMPVFDLTHPVQGAYDEQGKNVFAKERILGICRETLKKVADHRQRYPQGQIVARQRELSYNTPAGKDFYAGSTTFLRVPEFTTGEKKQ